MNIGKIPETVLKRSIFKQIKHRRNEVLIKPNVGEDCSFIKLDEDEVFVISTDPITGATNDIGKLAINITANDLASSGAEIIGVMLSILLPDGTWESQLREMMQDIEKECENLKIEVIGGHTEVTKAVNKPIITVTGVGKSKKDDIIMTKGAKEGQDIVMTKWAGLEGTAIIASDKKEQLKTKFTTSFIDNAREFKQYLSVIQDAKIAKQCGATSMHDVTEGGIFGALWEIAAASNVGLEVDLKKIPIRQETIEISEFYNINPYFLISSGCLLVTIDNGNRLVEELAKNNISSAVIGKIVKGKDRVIINQDEKRYLEPPKSDELYKVIDIED